MYKVVLPGTDTVLCRFAGLGNARRFARQNMPCEILNRSGKPVPIR